MFKDFVPRTVQTETVVIIKSQRPPAIKWKTFHDLHSLLRACDHNQKLEFGISRLVNACFPEAQNEFMKKLRNIPEKMKQCITSLVAIDNNWGIAGFAQIHNYEAKAALIANLCRAPDRRYRGLGAEVLRRTRNQAFANGVERIALRTSASKKKLRRYYEDRGWRLAAFLDNSGVVEYELCQGECVIFEV